MCHTKDFRDWPAYYLREQESKPTSLVLRRVKALVGAVFDRDGHLSSRLAVIFGKATSPRLPNRRGAGC